MFTRNLHSVFLKKLQRLQKKERADRHTTSANGPMQDFIRVEGDARKHVQNQVGHDNKKAEAKN
jgi:hypothetical protein